MTKKMVTVQVGDVKMGRLYGGGTSPQVQTQRTLHVGTVDGMISDLKKYKKEYGSDYANLHFVERRDCGCRYDCNCSPSLVLFGTRLENDLEYDFRIAREQKEEAVRVARDRAEYERLSKIYLSPGPSGSPGPQGG